MSRALLAASAAATVVAAVLLRRKYRRGVAADLRDLIGGTPLVRLRSLSEATGCEILGKCEFLNPGGSSKDRVAAAIVAEAEASGALRPGGTLVEATSGSTGVSLALLARACGYRCLLVVTDDVSDEKRRLMEALGAEVELAAGADRRPAQRGQRRAAARGGARRRLDLLQPV